MYPIRSMMSSHESHPARGAWIEMIYSILKMCYTLVAPRKGCVD